MRTRDLSFTIALCASLVLHGLLSYAVTESYVREFGRRIVLPALARATANDDAIPQLAWIEPEADPWRRLGDSNATGYAIDSSPGDEQLLAKQGMQDQPFLSRDPVGPGNVGDPPSESLIPPGDGGSRAPVSPPAAPIIAAAHDEPSLVGIQLPRETLAREVVGSPTLDHTDGETVAALTAPQRESAGDERAAPAPTALPASARPGPSVAADPAPKGQSELHPVSVIGSVEFRRGRTIAQLGRKHKITFPRLTVGSKVDLMTIGTTVLVLKFRTDADGNVVSADIHRSSGSEAVDQLFKVTAYEWWFEPPTDESGAPRADAFLFVVRLN